MHRFRRRLAAVLEWSAVDKALAIMMALTPILALYLWGISFALVHPERERLVRVDAAEELRLLVSLLAIGAVLIATLCLMLRRRWPDALWPQHLAAQYYSFAIVSTGYYIGTMTLCTGIIMLGAPVLGFVLLNRAVVWWATGVAFTALLALTYATAAGLLPYAPAVMPPSDDFTQLWWINTLYLFSAPHVIVILVCADQVVYWWHQRESTIRALSITDMLTGLHNRRSIMDLLEKEVARSHRDGQPLSVVILDLDHFKRINDTWGHPTGDRVLQEAAQVLRDTLRLGDAIGRYGGEEFMLLLPGTDTAGARALVERSRARLAETVIQADNGESLQVSASFGVVSNEANPDLDGGALIRAADAVLYQAKRAGRNRVMAAAA